MREDGFQVVVAAPEARTCSLVMHDRHPEWDITVESPGYKLKSDIAFRDIRPGNYIGLFLSGGRAPEYLRYDRHLIGIVEHFFACGKPVASICHGVEILAAADVIRGRAVATVSKCRLDVEFAGGTFVDEPVAVSGNLVSARTWHDNYALLPAFMKLLAAAYYASPVP